MLNKSIKKQNKTDGMNYSLEFKNRQSWSILIINAYLIGKTIQNKIWNDYHQGGDKRWYCDWAGLAVRLGDGAPVLGCWQCSISWPDGYLHEWSFYLFFKMYRYIFNSLLYIYTIFHNVFCFLNNPIFLIMLWFCIFS